jgi:hypothetical protein
MSPADNYPLATWSPAVDPHHISADRRLPSSPREFHPAALTDPDLTLLRHPVRAKGCRLPSKTAGSSGFPLTRDLNAGDPLPSPVGHYPRHHYYRGVRPSLPHRYFRPRIVALVPFPLASASWFLQFHTEALSDSRPLYADRRPSSHQAPDGLVPEYRRDPGFGGIWC